MDSIGILIIIAIAVALIFDIINGFHDAANSIATVVSTKVLTPKVAVLWAAFFNFAAMFVFAPKVADTISKIVKIDSNDAAYIYVVLAGLVGAIIWDLVTWWLGLPTSSSHAIIGGLAGAGIVHKGFDSIRWEKLIETASFIPLAPILGMAIGFVFMIAVYWIFRHWKPLSVDKVFRRGQLVSAALYSLGHGGNDAQKTMGIIVALLIAAGIFTPDIQLSYLDAKTAWIIVSCHVAMGLGTALGGWKIVKTMGMKLTKLKPVHGFCAESAGSTTLFLATFFGIPVSTTHTISGSIIGVGMTTSAANIKWVVAVRIVMAWFLTIPMSALVAGLSFELFRFFQLAN